MHTKVELTTAIQKKMLGHVTVWLKSMKFCMHAVKRSVHFGLYRFVVIDQLCWKESRHLLLRKKRFREPESVEHTIENVKKSSSTICTKIDGLFTFL